MMISSDDDDVDNDYYDDDILVYNKGVIDIGHINISITLLQQYSLLSLVNTYRNVSKYQKDENGLREEIES